MGNERQEREIKKGRGGERLKSERDGEREITESRKEKIRENGGKEEMVKEN